MINSIPIKPEWKPKQGATCSPSSQVEGLEDQGRFYFVPTRCPQLWSSIIAWCWTHRTGPTEVGGVHSITPFLNVTPPQQVHANVQDKDKQLIQFASSQ